jgi:proteasome lid subunit RPN8/RPN11
VNGRIEVNRALPPVVVPARVWNELRGHALETRPEECCGLLLGAEMGRFELAERCRNEMTRLNREDPATYPRSGGEGFHMNEVDYVRIQEQAKSQGLQVAGVYHSHVGAGAYFSELDQAFALQPLFPFPDADHVVISVVEPGVRDLAVFRRVPGTRDFEGRALAPGTP